MNNFTFVNDDFHARISAKSKCYEYIIEKCSKDCFNSDILDVEKEDFDLNKFQEILTYFNGEHNFMNFTSKEEDEQNFIRNIYSIGVENNVNLIHVTLVGNGFMRYMIRYIIGTALAYSRNKITKDEIITLLNPVSSQRNIVSYKASPNGLYLKEVQY